MNGAGPTSFRLAYLLVFYVLVVALGVTAALFDEMPAWRLLISAGLALSLTFFCIADSRLRSKPMPHAAQWLMLFTWPVAVPIYLVWSRGWEGLGLALLHAVAVIVVVAAAGSFAGWIVWG